MITNANPLRGVFLFIAGVLLFACLDTSVKYLAASYPVPMIVGVRYIGNLLLMVALLAPRNGAAIARTQRTGLVVVRALCLAGVSLFAGLALQRIPVAEATAINFLAPMLVVVVAGPLLGERVGWAGWGAALLGFAGVLIIVRPGSGLDAVGVACALIAVTGGVGYQLLSRILVATETTMALLFYTALAGSIFFGLALPWYWGGPAPSALVVALFAAIGAFGGLGHFLITAAYRYAPASLLAPTNYLQLVWAGLLGWAVFGHVPDRLSALGMGVIAISGIAVAVRSHRQPVKRTV